MNMKQHITENGVAYLLASIMSVFGFLLWSGAMAFLDARHITHIDWIDSEITETEEEIVRLELYNEFGSGGNKPARVQIIKQLENKKQSLERDKDRAEGNL